MIDQIVYVFGFELMNQRNGYRAIGCRGQESHAPVDLVPGAQIYFIAFFESAGTETYMQKSYTLGYIAILQGNALIIGKCSALPIRFEALFEQLVYRLEFHILIFSLVQFI